MTIREGLGRLGVALMVPFVLLWVGLMLALVVPVAAVDWLYQRLRRRQSPARPGGADSPTLPRNEAEMPRKGH